MAEFRTAYEESLSLRSSGGPNFTPDYITAADTLSLANRNKTYLESAFDSITSIPKFIGASLISGANQLYNILPDVGNLLGGDFERSDTAEVISGLDSDLGQFYQEHQEGIDVVGFIASSLVPGMAGIKVLNAGQSSLRAAIGRKAFGDNTGKALGLLAPQKAVGLEAAKKAAATSVTPIGLSNRNALRSIGAGFGQNFYEALAFETAVSATLFNSPILENQEFGDFVTNVALGAGVFGLVGGVLDASRINSALRLASDKAKTASNPWTFLPEAQPGSSTYEKIALDYDAIHAIPPVPENIASDLAQFYTTQAKKNVAIMEDRLKTNIRSLGNGDDEVGRELFKVLKGQSATNQIEAIKGVEQIGRMTATAKFDLAKRSEELLTKITKGKATLEESTEFMANPMATSTVRTWGEDTGRVISSLEGTPILTSIVDTLKKGQKITVSKAGVTAGKQKWSFHIGQNLAKGKPPKKLPKFNILGTDPLQAQARYIWAQKLDIEELRPTAANRLTIDESDIPLLEAALIRLDPADRVHTALRLENGNLIPGSELNMNFLADAKIKTSNKLLGTKAPGKEISHTQEEIAAIVNTKSNFLGGEVFRDSVNNFNTKDILALQDHAEEYTQRMIANGSLKEGTPPVDIWQVPQTLKLIHDTTPFKDLDGNVLTNMAGIKQQQKLYQDGLDRASTDALPQGFFARLIDISSGRGGLIDTKAVPSGAGPGLAAASDGNYGTLASIVNDVGRVTAAAIQAAKDITRETLEPLVKKLGDRQEAYLEWSGLQQKVRSIEAEYGLNPAGDGLEPLLIKRWRADAEQAVAEGKRPPVRPTVPAGTPENIPFITDEVRELATAHIEINSLRTGKLGGIRTAQGVEFNRSPDAFYVPPVDIRDYQHFAIVKDRSITSGNHTKMLYATSGEDLAAQISKFDNNPQLEILTKGETKRFFEGEGRFEYEKTFSDNYMDVEAHRKGVSAPFLVATDPQKIASDFLKWHADRDTGLVREAVSAKYEVAFEELARMGDKITDIAESRFSSASVLRDADSVIKNPYADYIKTALAINQTDKYPWMVQVNQLADSKFSSLLRTVTAAVESTKVDADLGAVNQMLRAGGYKGAAYDADTALFANAKIPKGALNTLVQNGNSVLAAITLRLDVINAANNAISANVLLGAETAAVIRAIGKGDAEAVGALASLTRITVPGSTETIFSPTKLIGNSMKKFGSSSPEAVADRAFWKQNGFDTSISDQYRQSLENLTFDGVDVSAWSKGISKTRENLVSLANKGEKWTGNKLAEEFNRFVAADVMKQMTDVAVTRGLLSGKEQIAYINTFVNRTQGNYLASQRPLMFKGAIGQAIGLFQTYQFNLMQQLLRHVGEGTAKDSMTLLALQGTIHGMNGLPGFNAVNTHLLGTASGNTEHRDAYDVTYGILGKEAGDWLMYGTASNALGLIDPALKMNLYTRGDINPRHVTIVPTDPASVPIIQASARVFGNIIGTAKKLGAGGDVTTTLLQGLEHNGISRPLAGLAQTLKGFNNPNQASYSTSNRGNVIAANDLLSWANLGRIAGAKPLDEAIAVDATFRFKAYGLLDAKRKAVLGQAIKSTMIAGQDPTRDQIDDFASSYAAIGGRQEEFGSWMIQLHKTANLSQSNKISQSLRDPFAQSMQRIMGGKELEDFTR